jgi:hypothetical protein
MRILKFIIYLAVCLLAGSASAQSQWKAHPSVGEEFTNCAIVILGEVISARDVPEPGGFIRGTFYQIRVTEVFKGSPSKTVELYSENSSGRFPMQIGVSYLVFAREGVFEGIKGARLAIDSCGNSGTLEQSRQEVEAVRKLMTHHNAALQPRAMVASRSAFAACVLLRRVSASVR